MTKYATPKSQKHDKNMGRILRRMVNAKSDKDRETVAKHETGRANREKYRPYKEEEEMKQDQEQEVTEEQIDAELDALIAEMREDGLSDDEIVQVFETLSEENEEEAEDETKKPAEKVVEPINLMEVADAILNKEPAKVAEIFDLAIKQRLDGAIEEYKKNLAASLFTDPDPEEEKDDDSEEAKDDDCDGEVESEDSPFVPEPSPN